MVNICSNAQQSRCHWDLQLYSSDVQLDNAGSDLNLYQYCFESEKLNRELIRIDRLTQMQTKNAIMKLEEKKELRQTMTMPIMHKRMKSHECWLLQFTYGWRRVLELNRLKICSSCSLLRSMTFNRTTLRLLNSFGWRRVFARHTNRTKLFWFHYLPCWSRSKIGLWIAESKKYHLRLSDISWELQWLIIVDFVVVVSDLAIMNPLCKVCGDPAAGYHFGAFTCEGCKVMVSCFVEINDLHPVKSD